MKQSKNEKRKYLTYTPSVQNYLNRMIIQFEEGKLEIGEELQLMQDLVDTGLAWSYGEEIARMADILLQSGEIFPPESGFTGLSRPGYKVVTMTELRRKYN